MSTSIIYLGLDVHKESLTIAVLPADRPAPTRVDRLSNELPKLRRYLARLAQEGVLRLCYEASGAGSVLYRVLRSWGYHCDLIAPSLIPTKPGVQRKHNKYDAVQLARLYRAGELTPVRVPSEVEERIRDLVPCRETIQRELLKSRHYLLKFLARRGFVFRAGSLGLDAPGLAPRAGRARFPTAGSAGTGSGPTPSSRRPGGAPATWWDPSPPR